MAYRDKTSKITVKINASWRKIKPRKYLFDREVAERIKKEKILLAVNPSNTGLLIIKHNGHTTAGTEKGNRSVAKLVTGDRYRQKLRTAKKNDYRIAAFKPDKGKKAKLAAADKAVNTLPVPYVPPTQKLVDENEVIVYIDGREVRASVETIRKIIGLK